MSRDKKQEAILRKVLRRIAPHWMLLAGTLLLALACVACQLYVPILVGRGVDCILGPGQVDFETLGAILLWIGLTAAAGALAQWCMGELNNRITFQVVRDLREEAFRHIQELPLRYLDRHPHGETVSRIVADVDQFADGLLMGFTQLFTGLMTIGGTLLFMLLIHWKIALVVIFITPVSLFVAQFVAKRTYSMFRLQSQIRGRQTALIDETIGELKVVQAFGHQSQSQAEFDQVNEELRKCSLRAIFFSSITNPCTRFVNALVYAGVGLTGALAAVSGGITVGGLTTFLSYANQYTKPFNEISGVITELQNALACAGRIFELLEEPAQAPDSAPGKLAAVKGQVELDHVFFSYTPDRPLIQDFSLRVRPGQRVAIVGPTGCGKTTMINLLMRFYEVDRGSILVDGVQTRSLARQELRQCFGMVLQDTWLKAGTIRENIAMGRPEATLEEIQAAARAAHAHGFIRRLPEGYDTVIGEAGGSLSQGQKQLLCIARVMLCLPPMLILDEATSSIDTRTEQKIQQAFAALMEGRTSFIVAHRLSTIQEADLILVMRDGAIVEQGTHASLLAQGGFYAELYESQFAH
ncbi:MAG: ABC transporter ATP-binding protein [Oscillospiraceae bacterium]